PVLAEPEGDYEISAEDITLFSAGETTKLRVSGLGSGDTVTWTSSNPSVVSVADGALTAVSGGTATVTATVNGKALECIVRCKFSGGTVAPVSPDTAETGNGYHLSHTDVTLQAGESFRIGVYDAGGNAVSDGTLSTTDGGIASISGRTVTAGSAGMATVTVTVGGQSMECVIRVK
ncbi:MAG: Ig-like domain-containing protein, partial [Oscillospiraceae bacterium]|nr:Ig-like domain-containing protein [Oscillospiraceae bacterium]